MILYILRHASAGARRHNPLLDRKRGLDKEGKQQCLLIGAYLLALGSKPMVMTVPAVLALLGHRIDWLRLRRASPGPSCEGDIHDGARRAGLGRSAGA